MQDAFGRAETAHRAASCAQKRIGPTLRANGRPWTVPTEKGKLVPERQQLCPDRADQRIVIAIREVGPTNRALEQHIAQQRETRRMIHENDMPRCVTWAMQDVETMWTESDRI